MKETLRNKIINCNDVVIEKTSCGEEHKNEKRTEKIGHVFHVLEKSSERDRAREEIFTLGDKIVKLRSVLLEKRSTLQSTVLPSNWNGEKSSLSERAVCATFELQNVQKYSYTDPLAKNNKMF